MPRLLVCLLFVVLALGCERGGSPRPETGYDYFPLDTGQVREYEVIETRYALAQPPGTRIYQIRETLTGKYTDGSGQIVYRLERAVKEGNSWKADTTHLLWRTTEHAYRSENGFTFAKLQFPIYEGAVWNGNLLNTLGEQPYKLTRVNVTQKLGTIVFDKTLTVVHKNDSTLLSLRRDQEVYTPGIGLVRRENVDVRYCGTPDCLGKGIIEYGFSRISTLSNYGK